MTHSHILTGLVYSLLPYIINYCECLGNLTPLYNRMAPIPAFSKTLWPWVKVKVIHTRIKKYSLVIVRKLEKKIGSWIFMNIHKPILNTICTK